MGQLAKKTARISFLLPAPVVVGVTLAFINVDILTAATAIGMATLLMASLGTIAGRWMGPIFGRAAEVLGGICLIGIGTKILIEHTIGS